MYMSDTYKRVHVITSTSRGHTPTAAVVIPLSAALTFVTTELRPPYRVIGLGGFVQFFLHHHLQ